MVTIEAGWMAAGVGEMAILVVAEHWRDEHSRFEQGMILFLHNRYRTTGGEERVVDDLAWLVREQLGEPVDAAGTRLGAVGPGRAAAGLLRGGLAAGGGRGGGARRRGTRRARPQPAADAGLARAGGGALCGRARRAAPASVPPRMRGRGLLHARRGVHALPRPQHVAGGAAQLPRQSRPGARLRRGSRAVAAPHRRAGRRGDRPERASRANACASSARRCRGSGCTCWPRLCGRSPTGSVGTNRGRRRRMIHTPLSSPA